MGLVEKSMKKSLIWAVGVLAVLGASLVQAAPAQATASKAAMVRTHKRVTHKKVIHKKLVHKKITYKKSARKPLKLRAHTHHSLKTHSRLWTKKA